MPPDTCTHGAAWSLGTILEDTARVWCPDCGAWALTRHGRPLAWVRPRGYRAALEDMRTLNAVIRLHEAAEEVDPCGT